MIFIHSALAYLLFFLLVLNVGIGKIGLVDIAAILIFFRYVPSIKIKKKHIFIYVIPIILILLVIYFKIIVYEENMTFDSISIIFKLLLISIYISVFSKLNYNRINYKFIIVILSIPLLLSILMYFNNYINNILINFYRITPFPNNTRFGGIWGKDVNNFGLYASLVLLESFILFRYNKIKIEYFIYIICISSFCIILSGMRVGILSIILTLIIFLFIKLIKDKKGSIKLIIKIIIFIIIGFCLFKLLISILPVNMKEVVMTRFSLHNLQNDLFGFMNENGGNVQQARNYLINVIDNCKNNSILFGFDISQNYVDVFYIDMFIKYGFLGIVALAIFLYSVFKQILLVKSIKNKQFLFFIFIFSLIISFKGVFVLDMKFIFLVSFTIMFITNETKNA